MTKTLQNDKIDAEYGKGGAIVLNIIKEADCRRELKTAPRAGYLCFGEEDYLKAFAVRTAREVVCPDPTFSFFNEMRLDATDFEPQKLLDALMPMPMMADRKLVTLSGLNFNAMRQSDLDDLCSALATLADYDYNLLLVVAAADCLDPGYLPKRPSATLTRLAEYLTPVQFDRSTPAKLAAWVGKHFAHNGAVASPALCASMIDYCGRSMFALSGEVDKLSFYVLSHGRSEVTEADMRIVCTPAVEYDAFAFANALMEGRRDAALAILADYKFRRVDPIVILSDVIRVFCDMEAISALSKDGLPASEIAAQTKIHEFRVGLYLKSLTRTPEGRLHRAIDACAAADASLKLSPQGYTALERLICTV